MPTYEYECEACGGNFEFFQSITASPKRKCPECGRLKARRLIGPGAGIIFKGSGFYQTDYRSQSYKDAAKAEKQARTSSSEKSSESSSSKSETKSESKSDSKPSSGSSDSK